MEKRYTLYEVAAMYSVHYGTVWRWTMERGLKTVVVGRMRRIKQSDLEAWERSETRKRQAV